MADPNELLKWAIKNQGCEPKTGEQKQQQEDFIQNLDQKWYDALFSATNNDTERMKALIGALKDTETTMDQKIELLEQLEFLCELTHNANNLHALGGLAIVLDNLNDKNPKTRGAALSVLAISLPNNKVFQKQILKTGGLPMLLQLLRDDPDENVRRKALLSISGLTRTNEVAMKEFLETGGIAAIISALKSGGLRIQRRSAFFLAHILEKPHVSAETFHELGGTASLLASILLEDIDLTEKSLVALNNLAEKSEHGKNILKESCCKGQLQKLKEFLQNELERDPNFDAVDIGAQIIALEEML